MRSLIAHQEVTKERLAYCRNISSQKKKYMGKKTLLEMLCSVIWSHSSEFKSECLLYISA